MVLVIPNKLTVYSPYLVKTRKTFSILEDPTTYNDITNLINPLQPLRTLTNNSIKDVYLPDDTHLSSIGGEAVAICVANRLESTRISSKNY